MLNTEDEYIECPECEGDGITTCLCCEQEMECNECEGTGEVKNDDY